MMTLHDDDASCTDRVDWFPTAARALVFYSSLINHRLISIQKCDLQILYKLVGAVHTVSYTISQKKKGRCL